MEVLLQRLTTSDNGTFGILIKQDKPLFVTLELPWKNNQSMTSCIPVGRYRATKMMSNAFGKVLFVLHDVPGRDVIEVHIGNSIKDTHGCILLGMSFSTSDYMISDSTIAFNKFMTIMPEEFYLTIEDVIVKGGSLWV